MIQIKQHFQCEISLKASPSLPRSLFFGPSFNSLMGGSFREDPFLPESVPSSSLWLLFLCSSFLKTGSKTQGQNIWLFSRLHYLQDDILPKTCFFMSRTDLSNKQINNVLLLRITLPGRGESDPFERPLECPLLCASLRWPGGQ